MPNDEDTNRCPMFGTDNTVTFPGVDFGGRPLEALIIWMPITCSVLADAAEESTERGDGDNDILRQASRRFSLAYNRWRNVDEISR